MTLPPVAEEQGCHSWTPRVTLSMGKMSYTVGTNSWPSPRLKATGNKGWDLLTEKLRQSNALAH